MHLKNNSNQNKSTEMPKKFGFSILLMIFLCFSCQQNSSESTNQITDSIAVNNRVDFKSNLVSSVHNYIENKVNQSIENETSYFSFAPFKMFYRSFFLTRQERVDNWMKTFNSNGLNQKDVEDFINNEIKNFNAENRDSTPLEQIQLAPFNKQKIMNDKAFETLNTMEFNVWFQNFWFDCLLMISFMLIIGLIANIFFSMEVDVIVSTIGIKIVIGGMFFLLFFTFNEIRADFSNIITTNYTANIINQITLK